MLSRVLDRVRFLWMLLLRGPRYLSDLLAVTNRRFCNSPSKIIGWHRGLPSYYLLSPPLMSKAASTSLATRLMSLYQWRPLPDLVSIAVNDRCDCACEYCSFVSVKQSKPVLSAPELEDVVRQAQDLGVATVNFVGGEPLLRPDLPRLVRSVDRDRSQAVLFTNGYLLAERAAELRAAGLTAVIVSLNAASAQEHDAMAGRPGLFARAVAGIAQARKERLLVGMSTVVRRGDLERGSLAARFDLAKALAVNDVIVFDAIAAGRYAGRQDLMLDGRELEQLIEVSAEYARRKDYPGIHAYAFSKSRRGFGCAGGVGNFYVSPYGDVCLCDFNPLSVGNVLETPLHLLWDRFAEQGITKTSLAGCRCALAAARRGQVAHGAR